MTMDKIASLFGLIGLFGLAGLLGMAVARLMGASAAVNSLYEGSTVCLVLAGLLGLVGQLAARWRRKSIAEPQS